MRTGHFNDIVEYFFIFKQKIVQLFVFPPIFALYSNYLCDVLAPSRLLVLVYLVRV